MQKSILLAGIAVCVPLSAQGQQDVFKAQAQLSLRARPRLIAGSTLHRAPLWECLRSRAPNRFACGSKT